MTIGKLRTLALAGAGAVTLASSVRAQDIKMPANLQTAISATTISGYEDTSAVWNPGTGNANGPGYAFGGGFGSPSGTKADGFNLNVVKLVIEHDPDPSDGWGAGYKVDLLFGPDAAAYGTVAAPTAFAIKQAYLDLKAPLGNGLEFKLGQWDTILGYEVFETTLNPNFTRSYGYTIEPASFTGLQATYNFTELIAVTAGIADSASMLINSRAFPPGGPDAESFKTWLGDVSLTAPSSWGWIGGSTLFGAIVNGYSAFAYSAGILPANQTSYYIGSTINTPLKPLKFGVSYDYEGANKTFVASSGSFAWATDLYMNYQVTDKLSVNTRGEFFSQSKGNATPGLPSRVLALTGTVEYDLWKNVMT